MAKQQELTEFFQNKKNIGPKIGAYVRFADMSTDVGNTCVIPKLWKEIKVIAKLKQGQPAKDACNYRPISDQIAIVIDQ